MIEVDFNIGNRNKQHHMTLFNVPTLFIYNTTLTCYVDNIAKIIVGQKTVPMT